MKSVFCPSCAVRHAFFDSLGLSEQHIHDMQAPYVIDWLDGKYIRDFGLKFLADKVSKGG